MASRRRAGLAEDRVGGPLEDLCDPLLIGFGSFRGRDDEGTEATAGPLQVAADSGFGAGRLLGFVGIMAVVLMFAVLVQRAFVIGREAIKLERYFVGLVAQGIGLWIGVQSFINMGVNLGALPTKGLTLPLMSYGGSAILVNMVAIAVVLRIDYENRQLMHGVRV